MYEILKVFAEQVFKFVFNNLESLPKRRDELQKKRNELKLSEIGSSLFSLYTTLNSIYVTGIRIIDMIEATTRNWEYLSDLHLLLRSQAKNIMAFGLSFVELSRYFNIIDPQSARDLALFLSTKMNIIGILISEMEKGSYVFSVSLEKRILDVVSQVKSIDPNFEKGNLYVGKKNRHLDQLSIRLMWDDILFRPEAEKIDAESIPAEKVAYLKNYLATRRPSEQLEAMRRILDRLHEKLISNFEVKDLLISVGKAAPQDKAASLEFWDTLGIFYFRRLEELQKTETIKPDQGG